MFKEYKHCVTHNVNSYRSFSSTEPPGALCQRFRFPKISVGSQMERYLSVPFNRNIPTKFEISRSILTNWFIGLVLFTYVENSEKEEKIVRAIPLGWPGSIGKCRSISLGYSHCSVTGRSGIMELLVTWSATTLGWGIFRSFRDISKMLR